MRLELELGLMITRELLTSRETEREAFYRAMSDPDVRQEYEQSLASGFLEIDDIPDRSVFRPRRVLRLHGGHTFPRIHSALQPNEVPIRQRSPHRSE